MPTYLEKLRDAIESATSLDELRAAVETLAPDLALANQELVIQECYPEPDRHAQLFFTPPVDARALSEAMGWERAYAASGDVHQQSWSIRVPTHDGAALYPGHVPTVEPEIGIWIVRAYLTGRPAGDFVFLIGPSPAYDLNVGSAMVANLVLQGWRRDWTAPVTGISESPRTAKRWGSRLRSWLPW